MLKEVVDSVSDVDFEFQSLFVSSVPCSLGFIVGSEAIEERRCPPSEDNSRFLRRLTRLEEGFGSRVISEQVRVHGLCYRAPYMNAVEVEDQQS